MALWIAMDNDGSCDVFFFNGKPMRIPYPHKGAYYWDSKGVGGERVARSIARKLNMKPGDCKRVKIVEDE